MNPEHERLFEGAPGATGATGAKGDKGEPGMPPGSRRAFVVLIIIVFALAGAALLLGVRQVDATNTQQARLRASLQQQCRFYSDLGTAPVAVNPVTRKAWLLAVLIVTDARAIWHGLGCTGHLGPAAPSLTRWARFYHVPVR